MAKDRLARLLAIDDGGKPAALETRARVGAVLLMAGAALGVLGLTAPGADFRNGYALGIAATTGAALGAVVAWAGARRLPRWAQDAFAFYGVALITLATAGGATIRSSSADNEVLYLLPVLYVSYFSTRRMALAVLAATGAAYLGVLLADGQRSGMVTRWVTSIGTLSIASLLVVALRDQVVALVRELRDQARTDALTGLANRRAFLEALEAEVARSARSGQPLSVVLCDVDGLKSLNDRCGHAAGDAALRAVAGALRGGRRDTDVVARLGGDEFAMLLPGCRPEDAAEAVARATRALAGHAGDCGSVVTVSCGVAGVPDDGTDAGVLLDAADAALYRAKRAGRDRVVSATPGGRATDG